MELSKGNYYSIIILNESMREWLAWLLVDMIDNTFHEKTAHSEQKKLDSHLHVTHIIAHLVPICFPKISLSTLLA